MIFHVLHCMFLKGVKWKQGMWSKEENDQLKENILEYCKVGTFCSWPLLLLQIKMTSSVCTDIN